mmetsp:Transcript_5603/g.8138  ORF Transcript_5603/g.8138 Transcript_5603/m.8138 type:complete len:304 (-) Transcript_5603:143-1054(-)
MDDIEKNAHVASLHPTTCHDHDHDHGREHSHGHNHHNDEFCPEPVSMSDLDNIMETSHSNSYFSNDFSSNYNTAGQETMSLLSYEPDYGSNHKTNDFPTNLENKCIICNISSLSAQCPHFNDEGQSKIDKFPPRSHNHHHEEEQEKNLNLHAAYLHVLADLAQSVAVLISGLIIWYKPSWLLIDPLTTIMFCFLVMYSTVGTLHSCISVLLNAVPSNIKWEELNNALQLLKGVENVHALHIWSVSHGEPVMSVHASISSGVKVEDALANVTRVCREKFGINRCTIQMQPSSFGDGCISCDHSD